MALGQATEAGAVSGYTRTEAGAVSGAHSLAPPGPGKGATGNHGTLAAISKKAIERC